MGVRHHPPVLVGTGCVTDDDGQACPSFTGLAGWTVTDAYAGTLLQVLRAD